MNDSFASDGSYEVEIEGHFERDLVSADAVGDERLIEAALRPKRLSEFIGQPRVREQLSWSSRGRCGATGRPTTC